LKRLKYNSEWSEEFKRLWRNDYIQMWNPQLMPLEYIFYQYRLRLILRWVELIQARKILDIGAAQGNFSLLLAEKGCEVKMNDINQNYLEYAMLKYERGNLQSIPGNIMEMEFDEDFDLILLLEILEHVAKPLELLKKIRKWLSKGGYVFITTPNGSFLGNKYPTYRKVQNSEKLKQIQFGPDAANHLFSLTDQELKNLGENAGYQIEKVTLFGTPFMKGWFKIRYFTNLFPISWFLYIDYLITHNRLFRDKLCIALAAIFRKC